MGRLITYVYIDGFNLYFRAVRGTPYRWLNPAEMCRRILPHDGYRIAQVNYYTARVKARPGNAGQPIRQEIYLRALRTLPELHIHFGRFLSHVVTAPLADGSGMVQVLRESEKGSDVNLAAHLVRDGYLGAYEAAVVVSNDMDLLEPVRIVGRELGKQVGIICPQRANPSQQLRAAADLFRTIRPSVLRDSQFPDVLTDAVGTFHKPSTW